MKESILFLVKGMKEYNMEKINDKIVLVRPHKKISSGFHRRGALVFSTGWWVGVGGGVGGAWGCGNMGHGPTQWSNPIGPVFVPLQIRFTC